MTLLSRNPLQKDIDFEIRNDLLWVFRELKTENEIKEKLRHLRDFTEDSKKELLDERNVIFKKITDEIRSIIEIKGKEWHFSLIMDDKALFYKESALYLTEEVIIILNDDAKKAENLKPKNEK